MRFVAYTSKTWWLLCLVIIGVFTAFLSVIWHRMPPAFQIIFSGLLALSFISIAFSMISSGPRFIADSAGLTCYPKFYRTIAWQDIRSCNRVPRRELQNYKGVKSYNFSFTEGWRPVDVYIENIGKYSKLPASLNRFAQSARPGSPYPDCFRLRMELTGTTGNSAEFTKVIEFYMAGHS